MKKQICMIARIVAMIASLSTYASADQGAGTAQPVAPSQVNALIQEVSQAYGRLQTLTQEVSEHFEKHEGDKVKIKQYTHRYEMKKPDKLHIERYIQKGKPEAIVVSDGTTVWVYSVRGKMKQADSQSR